MNRNDFLKQVQTGQLLPVYLFLGEEKFFHDLLIKAALNKLIGSDEQEFNYMVLDAAGIEPEEFIRNLETAPFFGAVRIIRLEGLENAASNLDEAVIKGLNRLASGVFLFITAVKLDGRKKLHQEMQRRIVAVDCNRLKPPELANWIRTQAEKNHLVLTPNQARLMGERVGPDLQRIQTELEKVKAFAGDQTGIQDQDLKLLIPGEPEPDIFGLIDSVASRNPKLGLPKLKDLLDSGENELKILATLSRQFRNIIGALAARTQGANSKTLAEILGINPYVAEKSFIQSGDFTLTELDRILERLLLADYRIKTGQREPRLELELTVVEITTGM